MRPIGIGLLVFVCTFVGFLGGLSLNRYMPDHHLDNQSKETIKLGIGLIATMTALLLSLVTASVKSSFDDLNVVVKRTAAEVLTLDRALARYGQETKSIREQLREVLAQRIELLWPSSGVATLPGEVLASTRSSEQMVDQIRALTPTSEEQTALKSRALDLTENLLNARWTVVSSTGTSVPTPFLTVVIFWLTFIFVCFGLFAPRNTTVIVVLLVCALSIGGALFLIIEMDGPFDGLIRISGEPLRGAYMRLGQ